MLMAPAPAKALSHGNGDVDPGHHQVVGMEDQVQNLANRLKASAEADRHLNVFSIVGFGGVGKTTLAMEVCRLLEAEFQCQAMLSVLQAFEPSRDRKVLLKRVLEQTIKPKIGKEKGIAEQETLGDIGGMDADQLAKILEERLEGNRYLIVIDDVWTIQAWEAIQSVFPENNLGSRIIVTTRLVTVAKACNPTNGHFIHHMQPLKLYDSKRLFLGRVFGSRNATYPLELEDVMDNILKKCGGLPLAILSIANILAGYRSSESKYKWETICRSIGSQMESNPTLEGMRQIVTLSFNHLPHSLKGCMMYLSIFPEDYTVNKNRLLCRWIAEGLVLEKRGLTLMEVAESFLDELLSRNMIEAGRFYMDSVIEEQSYRVHDMLLEVMVSRSLEANFVSLLGGQYDGISYDRIRRLSIHGGNDGGIYYNPQKFEEVNVKHVRSLSMFHLQGHKLLDQLGDFTLLRMLDLQGCEGVTNKHVRYACNLYLLKFLSLRATNISVMPPQVGNLKHLQTLDVGCTLLDDLPETVTKLNRLERLLFSNYNNFQGGTTRWTLPRGLSKMKALRDVFTASIENDAEVAREIGELEQLQSLTLNIDIDHIDEEVLREIALSLSKRYSLRFLRIEDNWSGKILDFLHLLPAPPRLLRSLHINGGHNGTLPSWIGSLTHLVEFYMWNTEIDSDKLFDVLSDLPNLKTMMLSLNCYSHDKLIVRTSHRFPVLRDLKLVFMVLSRVLEFEATSMENLEKLEMTFYDDEETSIIGFEHLTNLKKVMLEGHKDGPILPLVLDCLKGENNRHPKPNQFQIVVTYD